MKKLFIFHQKLNILVSLLYADSQARKELDDVVKLRTSTDAFWVGPFPEGHPLPTLRAYLGTIGWEWDNIELSFRMPFDL
jgi:hypothetical protein